MANDVILKWTPKELRLIDGLYEAIEYGEVKSVMKMLKKEGEWIRKWPMKAQGDLLCRLWIEYYGKNQQEFEVVTKEYHALCCEELQWDDLKQWKVKDWLSEVDVETLGDGRKERRWRDRVLEEGLCWLSLGMLWSRHKDWPLREEVDSIIKEWSALRGFMWGMLQSGQSPSAPWNMKEWGENVNKNTSVLLELWRWREEPRRGTDWDLQKIAGLEWYLLWKHILEEIQIQDKKMDSAWGQWIHRKKSTREWIHDMSNDHHSNTVQKGWREGFIKGVSHLIGVGRVSMKEVHTLLQYGLELDWNFESAEINILKQDVSDWTHKQEKMKNGRMFTGTTLITGEQEEDNDIQAVMITLEHLALKSDLKQAVNVAEGHDTSIHRSKRL